jgi:thiaminase/transcriptional activator TenA
VSGADPKMGALFRQLRGLCTSDWNTYVHHRFVAGLADASLPAECFRHYLVQDYLFLVHFCRAYGLAAFKADTLADIRAAAAGLAAIAQTELRLHVAYCHEWELTEKSLAETDEEPATIAYTRYVLERGLAGDLLDLQVALAPCVIGYAEIGRRLGANRAAADADNPYAAWVEAYAGAEYQAVAAAHGAQMDALFARRGGDNRLPSLIAIFAQATRLETAFWEMGMSAPEERYVATVTWPRSPRSP